MIGTTSIILRQYLEVVLDAMRVSLMRYQFVTAIEGFVSCVWAASDRAVESPGAWIMDFGVAVKVSLAGKPPATVRFRTLIVARSEVLAVMSLEVFKSRKGAGTF